MICGAALTAPFHVGIATPDIDASMTTFGAELGLRWVALPRPPAATVHHTPHGPVRPAARVVYGSEGPMHVELLQSGTGTVYDPAAGTHLHHVGYWVDDLPAAVADAERDGWRWEVTMLDDDDRPSAFAYLARPGDTRIELVDSTRREALMDLLAGHTGSSLW